MTYLLATSFGVACVFFLVRYHWPLIRLRRSLEAGEIPKGINGSQHIRFLAAQFAGLAADHNDAEQRAAAESSNLRTVLQSLREGVVLLDAQRRIVFSNQAFDRLLPSGSSPLGRTLLELFRNHVLQRAIEASFATPDSQTTEYMVDVDENGSLVAKSLEVTSIGLPGRDGEIIGAMAVFHDFTRLRALEGMRRDFVANVSHELRTPLSIIGGYIETLIDDDLEDVPSARKFLKVMHKHTERLHLLVEDLLTISSLESQRVTLDFLPADLQAIIQRIVERLEPSLTAKGLKVECNFAPDFPLVEVDAHRVDQVFFNLLDNAIKHGGSGDFAIEIHGKISADMVQLSVRDFGPGIALKDQPHIFERFYRVDEARSREVGGTGLGLSIVKHVVQAHGGTVEVTSQGGKGTTFQVTLPIKQSQNQL